MNDKVKLQLTLGIYPERIRVIKDMMFTPIGLYGRVKRQYDDPAYYEQVTNCLILGFNDECEEYFFTIDSILKGMESGHIKIP